MFSIILTVILDRSGGAVLHLPRATTGVPVKVLGGLIGFSFFKRRIFLSSRCIHCLAQRGPARSENRKVCNVTLDRRGKSADARIDPPPHHLSDPYAVVCNFRGKCMPPKRFIFLMYLPPVDVENTKNLQKKRRGTPQAYPYGVYKTVNIILFTVIFFPQQGTL